MYVTHLTCYSCGRRFDADVCLNLCQCGKPLRVEYDLDRIRGSLARDDLAARPRGMWRFRELLPLPSGVEAVTLGEGDTPLIRATRLGSSLDLTNLYVKDESLNPTGSFKARGMSAAVSMARHFGRRKLAAPSAGNAGGSLAAYAAAAGMEAFIFMPRDVPAANRLECKLFGANVTLVDGLIDDCGREVARRKDDEGWFDVSTLKEPYRAEGKKIMGYELAEQLGWSLPDVILYPTGGGTGLIGMARAFDEMQALGWIGPKRPRFVSVQSAGCAPIVRAFETGNAEAVPWEHGQTVAAGLRVPRAVGDFIILREVRRSGGIAICVDDRELVADARELSRFTGISACPEGGACLAALKRLLHTGWVRSSEIVVLFNTGSALKYAEAFAIEQAR